MTEIVYRCERCKARVFEVKRASGTPIVVNASPHENGNMAIVNGHARPATPLDSSRFIAHAAVCWGRHTLDDT